MLERARDIERHPRLGDCAAHAGLVVHSAIAFANLIPAWELSFDLPNLQILSYSILSRVATT
jgi:hypothetical protein